jgi:DNA-binding beta-propeller fold protein YncE
MKFNYIIVSCLALLAMSASAQTVNYLSVPGYKELANIDANSYSVLPSGRYVSPAGQTIRITHDPFGLAISPDQKVAITMHENAITIIDLATMDQKRIPEYYNKKESPLLKGSFLGVAFNTHNNLVYLSGGDEGSVVVYDYVARKKVDSIYLDGVFNGKKYEGSFTSDLIYYAQKNELLILDRGNFRLVRYSLSSKKIIASIPTGRQPFGLAISPDQKTVLVANVGMYAYPLVEGTTKENLKSQYINWHPYGNNTKESIEGTEIEGKKIPGLGDPNVPDAMSVFCIDLVSNKTCLLYASDAADDRAFV